MAVPTLKAVRRHFADARITFFGSRSVQQVLSPTQYCSDWIEEEPEFLKNVSLIKRGRYSCCILLKNSFGSALTVMFAGIPRRIGYARDGRGWMLTDRLSPLKDKDGFVPVSAVDYYLKIAENLGADVSDRSIELSVDDADRSRLYESLPQLKNINGPLVIFVPGGAFGPSKCWPPQRFAEVADDLVEKYNASIVISIAPNEQEKQIAAQIQQYAKSSILSLADHPLSLGVLKALIERADLVITNDTGPRHIAAALKRKIVTLFGPNNPSWTQTGYSSEIQIIGKAPCVPCDKPVCRQSRHYCMESITVGQVMEAAEKLLSLQLDSPSKE